MRPTALVSTLADVVNAIVARFVALGDARSSSNLGGVALLIGKRYLPMSSNDAPPRIVFVLGDGDVGGVDRGLGIGKGYVAGIREELTCYVWGNLAAPAWLPGTEYRSGVNVANGGNVYRSVKSGASASSGGPTGTGQGIADNETAWDYIAAAPPYDASETDIAKQLAMRLINCLALAPGRMTKAKLTRSVDPNVEAYGQDYTVTATYTYGVPRDRAIWAVPVTPVSPPDPMRPEGDAGTTMILNPAADGSR